MKGVASEGERIEHRTQRKGQSEREKALRSRVHQEELPMRTGRECAEIWGMALELSMRYEMGD
jgi:hypothetical protein